jgi:hypothetical protein
MDSSCGKRVRGLAKVVWDWHCTFGHQALSVFCEKGLSALQVVYSLSSVYDRSPLPHSGAGTIPQVHLLVQFSSEWTRILEPHS